MKIDELKSTENKKGPFCNSDSKILDEHEKDCFLRLLMMGAIPPDVNIIEQYNKRPIEDAVREELEDTIGKIKNLYTDIAIYKLGADTRTFKTKEEKDGYIEATHRIRKIIETIFHGVVKK